MSQPALAASPPQHTQAQGHTGPRCLTSSRQPDIRVRVHKETQVEHVPDLLAIEHQDALKKNHVCWVHHCGLWQPDGEMRPWALLESHFSPRALIPWWEKWREEEFEPQKLWENLCYKAVCVGPRGDPLTGPLRNPLLTLNASQNRKWGPRQFCPPRCFSESYASDHCQKHLQRRSRRQDHQLPWCSTQDKRGPPSAGYRLAWCQGSQGPYRPGRGSSAPGVYIW